MSANATKAATIAALLSAALYGASVPLSKVLLEGITSNWLSALLYLGAGIACGIAIAARNAAGRRGDEASLAKSDLPAVVLMLAGTWLTLSEHHEHAHEHTPDLHHAHGHGRA